MFLNALPEHGTEFGDDLLPGVQARHAVGDQAPPGHDIFKRENSFE